MEVLVLRVGLVLKTRSAKSDKNVNAGANVIIKLVSRTQISKKCVGLLNPQSDF